mgnify:CR=1 FL=1
MNVEKPRSNIKKQLLTLIFLKFHLQLFLISLKRMEGISVETWVSFVAEVGFPIAVTFYLLLRIEGKLNILIESIRALPEQLK